MPSFSPVHCPQKDTRYLKPNLDRLIKQPGGKARGTPTLMLANSAQSQRAPSPLLTVRRCQQRYRHHTAWKRSGAPKSEPWLSLGRTMTYRTAVKTLRGMAKSQRGCSVARRSCRSPQKAPFTPTPGCELSPGTLKSKHRLPGR